jgi:hypothetical protein
MNFRVAESIFANHPEPVAGDIKNHSVRALAQKVSGRESAFNVTREIPIG